MGFLNWLFWLVIFSYIALFVTWMKWLNLSPETLLGGITHILIIAASAGLALRFKWPARR